MSVQGPIPVEFGTVFPSGAVVITNGEATVQVTLVKPGQTTLEASVTDRPGIAGNLVIRVHPSTGTAKQFLVSAPATVQAGVGFPISATAVDGFGNKVTNYNGVPSIVWGIVAYALVVVPMKGFSAYAGGVALGS